MFLYIFLLYLILIAFLSQSKLTPEAGNFSPAEALCQRVSQTHQWKPRRYGSSGGDPPLKTAKNDPIRWSTIGFWGTHLSDKPESNYIIQGICSVQVWQVRSPKVLQKSWCPTLFWPRFSQMCPRMSAGRTTWASQRCWSRVCQANFVGLSKRWG